MEENANKEYLSRRVIGFILFALFFLLIGRNLSFIPQFNFSGFRLDSFEAEVDKITDGKKGFYSVYYKNLKTGDSQGIDEHQINTAYSVNKVQIVTALYYLDSKGKLSLDERLTIQKKDIQDYGTGSIRYQKPGQNYSLRNLAKLALKQSDNTAAHVIAVRIGVNEIQELVDSWEMKQTNMQNNKTTSYDMAILFEKIHKGEIANPANTKELLEFMTKTDFEERLPKYLPKSTKTYHKTGDGEGFVHDVGIIESKNSTYYLGIMTSDISKEETETKETIANISKKIFDILN